MTYIIVILNLLPFNAILSFEKRKKLHGTELCEFRQYGMTVILFSDRNSCTDKAESASASS